MFVPFAPSSALLPCLFWSPVVNTRKKGTLIIKGLLKNLVEASHKLRSPIAELRSWDPEPDLEGKRSLGGIL